MAGSGNQTQFCRGVVPDWGTPGLPTNRRFGHRWLDQKRVPDGPKRYVAPKVMPLGFRALVVLVMTSWKSGK